MRAEILRRLDGGLTSAVEVSRATGVALGTVSYHFQQLTRLGLIELRSTTPRRGAVEPHYALVEQRSAAAGDWSKLSATARRAAADETMQQLATELREALRNGAFERTGAEVSSVQLDLDDRGRRAVIKELAALRRRLQAIERESAKRANADPASLERWSVSALHFPTQGS